ncbi:MAG: hypothetical protein QXE66_03395 [Desulfurococcaceae archaeon]
MWGLSKATPNFKGPWKFSDSRRHKQGLREEACLGYRGESIEAILRYTSRPYESMGEAERYTELQALRTDQGEVLLEKRSGLYEAPLMRTLDELAVLKSEKTIL